MKKSKKLMREFNELADAIQSSPLFHAWTFTQNSEVREKKLRRLLPASRKLLDAGITSDMSYMLEKLDRAGRLTKGITLQEVESGVAHEKRLRLKGKGAGYDFGTENPVLKDLRLLVKLETLIYSNAEEIAQLCKQNEEFKSNGKSWLGGFLSGLRTAILHLEEPPARMTFARIEGQASVIQWTTSNKMGQAVNIEAAAKAAQTACDMPPPDPESLVNGLMAHGKVVISSAAPPKNISGVWFESARDWYLNGQPCTYLYPDDEAAAIAIWREIESQGFRMIKLEVGKLCKILCDYHDA